MCEWGDTVTVNRSGIVCRHDVQLSLCFAGGGGDGVMEAERTGVLGVYVLILHGALVVLLCLLVAMELVVSG